MLLEAPMQGTKILPVICDSGVYCLRLGRLHLAIKADRKGFHGQSWWSRGKGKIGIAWQGVGAFPGGCSLPAASSKVHFNSINLSDSGTMCPWRTSFKPATFETWNNLLAAIVLKSSSDFPRMPLVQGGPVPLPTPHAENRAANMVLISINFPETGFQSFVTLGSTSWTQESEPVGRPFTFSFLILIDTLPLLATLACRDAEPF